MSYHLTIDVRDGDQSIDYPPLQRWERVLHPPAGWPPAPPLGYTLELLDDRGMTAVLRIDGGRLRRDGGVELVLEPFIFSAPTTLGDAEAALSLLGFQQSAHAHLVEAS